MSRPKRQSKAERAAYKRAWSKYWYAGFSPRRAHDEGMAAVRALAKATQP